MIVHPHVTKIEEELRKLATLAADWDGYGAAPATPEGIRAARRFAALLPEEPAPEVCLDPDGEVSFGWFIGDQVFSVSVSPGGRLAWAGLAGVKGSREQAHGDETLGHTLPPIIAKWIARFKTPAPPEQPRPPQH